MTILKNYFQKLEMGDEKEWLICESSYNLLLTPNKQRNDNKKEIDFGIKKNSLRVVRFRHGGSSKEATAWSAFQQGQAWHDHQ